MLFQNCCRSCRSLGTAQIFWFKDAHNCSSHRAVSSINSKALPTAIVPVAIVCSYFSPHILPAAVRLRNTARSCLFLKYCPRLLILQAPIPLFILETACNCFSLEHCLQLFALSMLPGAVYLQATDRSCLFLGCFPPLLFPALQPAVVPPRARRKLLILNHCPRLLN